MSGKVDGGGGDVKSSRAVVVKSCSRREVGKSEVGKSEVGKSEVVQ